MVPTNRFEQYEQFLDAWEPLFWDHEVSVFKVEDREPWKGIPDFIPRRSDMIRSWGIYQSWKAGTTYTLSLDDDVRPEEGVDIFEEYERVFESGAPLSGYLSVGSLTTYDGELRGFPFADRQRSEVAVQYGGWNGVLDYDAPTQLAGVRATEAFRPVALPVPRGAAVTGCIMNCAWRTEYAPIMWQLPLHEGRYNRFGDIWSCLLQKKVLDAIGKVMIINGKAVVRHERASDPLNNLDREHPGIRPNEDLWRHLARWDNAEPTEVYRRVTDAFHGYFRQFDKKYAKHFKSCRDQWLELFEK